MTGMDTVTKPTIVVDAALYAADPDVEWHVNDRAPFTHLVLVVTDPSRTEVPEDIAWDMIITNSSSLPPEEFHQRSARVLSGTPLTPGLVFTFNEFMDDWYAYGAAVVLTEGDV